jgi:hypothetical protein
MSIRTTKFEVKNSEKIDRQLSNPSNSEPFPKLGYSFKEAQKITGWTKGFILSQTSSRLYGVI